MYRRLISFTLVAAFSGPQLLRAAGPAPPVELAPTGPWNLHYENEACKLRRSFGPEDNRVSIELAKFGPGQKFQFILFGNALRPIYSGRSYKVAFGSLTPHDAQFAMRATDTRGFEVSILGLPGLIPADPALSERKAGWSNPVTKPLAPETIKEIKAITITIAKKEPIVLKTGSLGQPLAAWDSCIADVLRRWGLDPAQQLQREVVPEGNPGSWFGYRDYPSSALQQYKGGLVNFRLMVDEMGSPTHCAVQRAVNEEEFAKVTCALLMKRARFQPAIDMSGKTVPGLWQSTVRFSLP